MRCLRELLIAVALLGWSLAERRVAVQADRAEALEAETRGWEAELEWERDRRAGAEGEAAEWRETAEMLDAEAR